MAQQKKTTKFEIAQELPEITSQQLAFVMAIVRDGKSQADAYRIAYNAENMGNKSIYVEASRLANSPDIALWMTALRIGRVGTAKLSLDDHLREMERLREIAIETGNVGAAVQAETVRGKVAGHHVERIQDVTKANDPRETLRQIAEKEGDEFANSLAAKYGIKDWDEHKRTRH